jgi:hypothetical protein
MIAVALAAAGAITSANAQTFPHGISTSEARGNFQKAEIEKWWPVINAAGIKVQ